MYTPPKKRAASKAQQKYKRLGSIQCDVTNP
jgi:hypothetical protein